MLTLFGCCSNDRSCYVRIKIVLFAELTFEDMHYSVRKVAQTLVKFGLFAELTLEDTHYSTCKAAQASVKLAYLQS